jgi:hypothetical protein
LKGLLSEYLIEAEYFEFGAMGVGQGFDCNVLFSEVVGEELGGVCVNRNVRFDLYF